MPSVLAAAAALVLLSPASVSPLPVGGEVDYQLGGAYPPPPGATVVVRDRLDPPAEAGYDVCYLNAFQTQPGTLGWWRRNHPRLLLRDRSGRPVTDPGWPDERLLDHRPAVRAELTSVMTGWIRGCAAAGFDAVEFDNLDSYTRSGGLLTSRSATAYAADLVGVAHDAGLAAGQKNDVENSTVHRRNGFDFAVTESCQRYAECDVLARAYGDAVLEIEYTRSSFTAACADHGDRWRIVLRDRLLRPAGKPGYRFDAC